MALFRGKVVSSGHGRPVVSYKEGKFISPRFGPSKSQCSSRSLIINSRAADRRTRAASAFAYFHPCTRSVLPGRLRQVAYRAETIEANRGCVRCNVRVMRDGVNAPADYLERQIARIEKAESGGEAERVRECPAEKSLSSGKRALRLTFIIEDWNLNPM